jgi:hypothetical protein
LPRINPSLAEGWRVVLAGMSERGRVVLAGMSNKLDVPYGKVGLM